MAVLLVFQSVWYDGLYCWCLCGVADCIAGVSVCVVWLYCWCFSLCGVTVLLVFVCVVWLTVLLVFQSVYVLLVLQSVWCDCIAGV